MKINLLIILFSCIVGDIFGQSWILTSTVSHPNLDQIVTDQLGNIYVTNKAGELTKYSSNGKRLLEYAPTRVATIQQIAPSTQLKVILFYENLQEFVILDRYLSFPVQYPLRDFKVGYAEHLTPGNPTSLWAFDISDFSIKLLDLRENRLLERKSLAKVLNQETANIRSFHAHQNRLYLVDKITGIQVFDNIGNYLFTMEELGQAAIFFDKDYLYYAESGLLKFIHLYNEQSYEVKLPDQKLSQIRYSNGHLIAATDKGFNIYQYLSAD